MSGSQIYIYDGGPQKSGFRQIRKQVSHWHVSGVSGVQSHGIRQSLTERTM